MFSGLIILFLLTAQANPAVRQFHKASKEVFPRAVIGTDLCSDRPKSDCWKDFLDQGELWAGDVNDDGVDELLIFPGVGWSGSIGNTYFLYQERGDKWAPLYLGEDGPDDTSWQVPDPRFDILPIIRSGYHDLRVADAWCLKWNGKNYVSYADADYHQLPSEFFNKSNFAEAEIFWTIRYRGLKQILFEPQWFSVSPNWKDGANVEVDDPEQEITWIAFFKGGIWGVKGSQAFLLLPQPTYRGSEKMELKGDWLIIYGEYDGPSSSTYNPPIVARYNRRTHELRIEQ